MFEFIIAVKSVLDPQIKSIVLVFKNLFFQLINQSIISVPVAYLFPCSFQGPDQSGSGEEYKDNKQPADR